MGDSEQRQAHDRCQVPASVRPVQHHGEVRGAHPRGGDAHAQRPGRGVADIPADPSRGGCHAEETQGMEE